MSLVSTKYFSATNESTRALNQTMKHTNQQSADVTLYTDVSCHTHFGWILIFFFCCKFFFPQHFSVRSQYISLFELSTLQHTIHKNAMLSNKRQPCFLLVWYLCTVSKKTELSIGESVSLPSFSQQSRCKLHPQQNKKLTYH